MTIQSPTSSAVADALPVAANRLTFYLPWRFGIDPADPAALPPTGSVQRVVDALLAHSDEGLRQRADRGAEAAAAPVWRALDAARSAASISGDFYPLATRILCGDPTDATGDSGAPPLLSINGAADAPGAWLSRMPLELCVRDNMGVHLLQVRLHEAWVRVFGTGVGLLGVTLEIVPAGADSQGLAQVTLLRALHLLAQPPLRDSRPLARTGRWTTLGGVPLASAPQEGDWLVVNGAGEVLVTGDIGRYLAWCKADDGKLLALYRCVRADADPASGIAMPPSAPEAPDASAAPLAGVAAGAFASVGVPMAPPATARLPTWRITAEVIEVEWVQWASADAQAVKAGRRLRPTPAGAMEPSNADDPLVTHQALASTSAGQSVLAQRLPRTSSLVDWMFAMLPDADGLLLSASADAPARAAAAGPQTEAVQRLHGSHTSARLFSYAAVRIDDPVHTMSPDALRLLCFRLSRRFDLNYQPAADELSSGTYLPFDTIAHGVATQGAAMVVANDGTEFLRTFLGDAFAKSYRSLGEICQHEYVYLVGLVQQSAFRPSRPPGEADVQRLRSLIQSLARFRLYYQFSQISHMAHHNSVLALWRRALGLDRVEADLSRDAGEAHRLLDDDLRQRQQDLERQVYEGQRRQAEAQRQRDEAFEQAQAMRARRWRRVAVVGSAVAAFLSVSEGIDRWAQRECPPEQLSVALTDMQTHGGNLLEILDRLKQQLPNDPASAGKPLLDRVCADTALRATAAAVAASAPTASRAPDLTALLAASADATKDTWAQRLERTCQSTQPFRQCAARASEWRIRGFWISLVAAVLIGWFVALFKPLDGRGD